MLALLPLQQPSTLDPQAIVAHADLTDPNVETLLQNMKAQAPVRQIHCCVDKM